MGDRFRWHFNEITGVLGMLQGVQDDLGEKSQDLLQGVSETFHGISEEF